MSTNPMPGQANHCEAASMSAVETEGALVAHRLEVFSKKLLPLLSDCFSSVAETLGHEGFETAIAMKESLPQLTIGSNSTTLMTVDPVMILRNEAAPGSTTQEKIGAGLTFHDANGDFLASLHPTEMPDIWLNERPLQIEDLEWLDPAAMLEYIHGQLAELTDVDILR